MIADSHLLQRIMDYRCSMLLLGILRINQKNIGLMTGIHLIFSEILIFLRPLLLNFTYSIKKYQNSLDRCSLRKTATTSIRLVMYVIVTGFLRLKILKNVILERIVSLRNGVLIFYEQIIVNFVMKSLIVFDVITSFIVRTV